MAGKTLTGIGEDESGKHELAADQSDSALRADSNPRETKPPSTRPTDRMPMPSTRPTDRMPMSTIIGAVPPLGAMPMPAQVDDDKVAEGLKKLRSLDEPLGPIPSSMPTLKEGIPAFGSGAPTPVNPAAIAATAAAELIRSRGTAHGHALSAAAGGQGVMPVSVDDRMKGTLLGHSLHLPDLPEVVEESRPAEVRSIARAAPTGALTPAEMNTDFSHGDARFFESEPINNEYEPERHVRSHKVLTRALIFAGVVAIFVVAAIAWTRAHKTETAVVVPVPAAAPETPPPTPAPDNAAAPNAAVAPAGTAPTADLPAAAPTPPPAAAATPPPPAAAAPAPPAPPAAAAQPQPQPQLEDQKPAAAGAPTRPPAPARAPTRAKREGVASSPRPTPHPSTHAPRPGEPARETTKPAIPSKRAKIEEDPDGTLPLDE